MALETFQVKVGAETKEQLSQMLKAYQVRGGYDTLGEALTALMPSVAQAAQDDADADVIAVSRDFTRMLSALSAEGTALANKVVTARQEARAEAADELDSERARADRLEASLGEARAEADRLGKELTEARQQVGQERARADEAERRMGQALALADALKAQTSQTGDVIGKQDDVK